MSVDDPNSLLTLSHFEKSFQAYLAKTKLDDANIASFIIDEHVATINPLYQHLISGIKLKVRQIDLAKASEILNATNNYLSLGNGESIPKCPRCRSSLIETGFTAIKSIKALVGFIIGVMTLSYPLYLDSIYLCKACNFSFKHLPNQKKQQPIT